MLHTWCPESECVTVLRDLWDDSTIRVYNYGAVMPDIPLWPRQVEWQNVLLRRPFSVLAVRPRGRGVVQLPLFSRTGPTIPGVQMVRMLHTCPDVWRDAKCNYAMDLGWCEEEWDSWCLESQHREVFFRSRGGLVVNGVQLQYLSHLVLQFAGLDAGRTTLVVHRTEQ